MRIVDTLVVIILIAMVLACLGCERAPLTPSKAGAAPVCTKPDANGTVWCSIP